MKESMDTVRITRRMIRDVWNVLDSKDAAVMLQKELDRIDGNRQE